MSAFRKGKSIKNLLVRTDHLTKTDKVVAGSRKCGRPRCRTCKHIIPHTSITPCPGSKRFDISESFTCQSTCLIYCISCTQCDAKYVGETSRQLNNRIGEHLRNIEKQTHLNNLQNSEDQNVSKHFNSNNHSINNLRDAICVDGHRQAKDIGTTIDEEN